MSVVDASKARLHVEGWGDATVLDAFIDPRNGRWAYRIERVCPDDAKDGDCDGSRIIYPDQIERLEWTVRGEMELVEPGDAASAASAAAEEARPPLLGGGGHSLGARILSSTRHSGTTSRHQA